MKYIQNQFHLGLGKIHLFPLSYVPQIIQG